MNGDQAPRAHSLLLAIDGSPAAKAAAYAAARIASALGWGVHAEYVVDASLVFNLLADPGPELGWPVRADSFKDRIARFREVGTIALAEVEDLCRTLKVPVTGEIVLGDVPATLLGRAPEHPLLALGRRGNRQGRGRSSLGQNLRHITHHSSTPLLVGGDIPSDFLRALLVYDGSSASRKALEWAKRLQGLFSELVVVSVQKAGPAAPGWLLERRGEIADSSLNDWQFVGEQGKPETVIAAVSGSERADMILMGVEARRGLTRLSGQLRAVLQETQLPVLAAA